MFKYICTIIKMKFNKSLLFNKFVVLSTLMLVMPNYLKRTNYCFLIQTTAAY